MAAAPISKIVLKNTTKISLNERFTAYRQQAQAQSVLSNVRQKMQMERQASVENRRLAQQMANRPSVIAALRLKKRSLQQRLGQKPNSLAPTSQKSNVKSRLNMNARRNSPVQGRLGRQRTNQDRNSNNASRKGARRKNRGRNVRPGTSPMLQARLGNSPSNNYRSNYRPRGGSGNFRGRGRSYARGGRQTNTSGQFGSNRSSSRGANRRRFLNRGGMNSKTMPTKQELDNQLDEYMAETKSHLDAQLDHYMSQGV